MPRKARVEQGHDGSYRMTVDRRYETLPALRRTAKTLCPFWFLILAVKIGFIGAPQHIMPKGGDLVAFMAFGTCALISVFTWMLAALGARSERFPAVIAFNIFTIVALFLHIARLFYLVIFTKSTNSTWEATALTETLEASVKMLADHRDQMLKVFETLHVAIDGGLLLVGVPMVTSLHLYILEKKKALKSGRKHAKSG